MGRVFVPPPPGRRTDGRRLGVVIMLDLTELMGIDFPRTLTELRFQHAEENLRR